MSSLQGIHTRRYHGEFISGESAHRYNLVSSLNETLQSTHGSIPLRSTFYPDAIHPDGYRFLEQFSRELHPVFTFRAGEITVRKSVVALSERDLILFQYEYDGPPQDDLRLSLEPLFAFREIHALTHSTVHQSLSIEKTDESIYRVSSSPDLPSCSLLIPESDFSYHPLWHYAVTYPMEEERGFPAKEDLRSLGSFTCPFPAYRPLLIAIGGRDLEAFSQEELHKRYQGELRRRHDQRKGAFHHRTECLTERERLLLETLVQAADQFLITDTAGDVRLLAGYPWFYEWGRDTFISLPGLCCATGRFADGAALLTRFARKIQYGLIPNRFLEESTETAEYNSVDASLWFAVAAGSFCREQPENTSLSDLLFAVMKEIITAFRAGTLFDIQVDHDGFLRAGNANTQLTWMDAKVGDEAITPRHGKAVELNALWYNLLCFFRERCTVRGEDDELLTSVCAELSTFQERFQAMFWNETDQCLFDLITEEGKDSSIRPNQIFALSLPFP
ncbi:glycogen debranching enzyme N-terminal domain-containing protein, partial [bacterium]|nr:glycogen debranching enzyme N-terminal domain-containing protein [bacterium]